MNEAHSVPGTRAPVGIDGDDLISTSTRILENTGYPGLVLEIPSERIVASSPAAAALLDPSGGEVVGELLQTFTADRPSSGPDLFAGGRLNGFEAFRVLRRPGRSDLKVRMWIRSFADQPSSRFVLVIIVPDRVQRLTSSPEERVDLPAVVGTADAQLRIERISSDAHSLFGWPVADLLGQPLQSLIAERDVANCVDAIAEAARSENGVTLYLDVRSLGPESERDTMPGCEVLILPLRPAPSCTFVFLPTTVPMSRKPISADLSQILVRLGRGAEIAQLARGATAGIAERDLPGLSRLTTRELEILTKLLDGDRAPAIAAELFLTQGTVRNHLNSIFSKVGVTSQQQLLTLFRAARARRQA